MLCERSQVCFSCAHYLPIFPLLHAVIRPSRHADSKSSLYLPRVLALVSRTSGPGDIVWRTDDHIAVLKSNTEPGSPLFPGVSKGERFVSCDMDSGPVRLARQCFVSSAHPQAPSVFVVCMKSSYSLPVSQGNNCGHHSAAPSASVRLTVCCVSDAQYPREWKRQLPSPGMDKIGPGCAASPMRAPPLWCPATLLFPDAPRSPECKRLCSPSCFFGRLRRIPSSCPLCFTSAGCAV